MPTDHYQALGVAPEAGPEQIRAAYLRLMRANHPDRRPADPVAASVARRANVAWDVLRDPSRRGAYDRARGPLDGAEARARMMRAAAHHAAYSRERADYRRAFTTACLRVGTAIVGLGTAVLLALV